MKKVFFTAGAFLMSAAGQFSFAYDNPVVITTVSRPVVQTVQSVVYVTETVTVQPSLTRLDSLQVPVRLYVEHCRTDLANANSRVAKVEKAVLEIEKELGDSLTKMTFLQELIEKGSCSYCVNGKLYSKDEIAKVLSLKINNHETRDALRVLLSVELADAKQQQKLVAERVQKWEAKQKDLVGRVNAIREQTKAREKVTLDAKQAAAAKAAIDEASKLAESLEAQMKSTPEALPAPTVPSERVSQAAADFDRLFTSQEVATSR